MKMILITAAIFIGALLPIQGALLAKLGPQLNHPIQATLISYIGGSLVCLFILLISKASFPSLSDLASIDWSLYSAGFLGAIFVSGMLLLIPKIGVANMLAATLVGQLVVSSLIDHFGLFGSFKINLGMSRISGISILFLGLYFIQREA